MQHHRSRLGLRCPKARVPVLLFLRKEFENHWIVDIPLARMQEFNN